MKRLIVMVMMCIVVLAAVRSANALGVSVGAAAWYAEWQIQEPAGRWDTMDSTLLYGPVLALRFTQELSLSSAFLYGEFKHTDGSGNPEEIERIDSDSALIYGLGRYFKVFAGFKYIGYTVGSTRHASFGPGLGIGLVAPLRENLFFIANVSGMYLWGKDTGGENSDDIKFIEYAYNSNAALTYVFSSAPVSISLGGRYQYIESHYDEIYDRDMKQRIFGVTVSAIYSFEI